MLILKSYGKIFLASILTLFLAEGADITAVTLEDAKTWLAAALASTLPLAITALDPSDSRWGRTKKTQLQIDFPGDQT